MIYLSGVTSDRYEAALIANGIGLMIQRGNSYHLRCTRYPFYAIDIGMAASDADPYLAYLERQTTDRCLFAVSPDAYPDAIESLRRGLEYAPLIRAMGFPVAVVAQDGAERLAWPWGDMDCLFVGGKRTDNPREEWKLSSAAEWLVHEARNAGKWVHMGRVNSQRRIERAQAMGCLSADGTYIKYARRKRFGETEAPATRGAHQLVRWLASVPPTASHFETPSHSLHRRAAS